MIAEGFVIQAVKKKATHYPETMKIRRETREFEVKGVVVVVLLSGGPALVLCLQMGDAERQQFCDARPVPVYCLARNYKAPSQPDKGFSAS